MKVLGKFSVFILIIFFTGCASLPVVETVNKIDVEEKYTYEYDAPYDDVVDAVKSVIKESGWVTKKVSETAANSVSGDDVFLFALMGGHAFNLTDSQAAWLAIEPPKSASKTTYIHLRTPITFTSFGLNIYASVYEIDTKVGLKLSASTSEAPKKKKIPEYLNSFSEKIELAIKDKSK